MKRWLLMLGVVVLLILVIGGIKGYGVYKLMQGYKAQGVPKQTVSAMKAGFAEWQPELAAIGSLRAIRGADLAPEVAGVVEAIRFESGAQAKAGQVLLELRAHDEAARLASLKASEELAETVFKRDQAQYEAQVLAKATLDSDAANLKSARAQVAEQQALVDKKTIRAPFDGELGIRAVDLGQYLAAGAKIVTLQQLDPIYVDFNLPQQTLAQVAVGQKVTAKSDTFPDAGFDGEISAIDPQVDVDTRNVALRTTLKNPQRKLLPGMFVNLSIAVAAPARYLTLPQTAVTYNPYGETVFVLEPYAKYSAAQEAEAKKSGAAPAEAGPPLADDQLVAKQVFITTGARRGDQVAILTGLEEGEQVVTSGQLKLRNGTAVVVNNSVTPSNDPNPKPVDR